MGVGGGAKAGDDHAAVPGEPLGVHAKRISQAETSLAWAVIAVPEGGSSATVYAPESVPKSASRHTLRYRFCAFPRTYSGSAHQAAPWSSWRASWMVIE